MPYAPPQPLLAPVVVHSSSPEFTCGTGFQSRYPHSIVFRPGELFHRETYIKAEPSESPNDRNDRAIRVAAAWYAQRVPAMPVILLSNDADNRRKAAEAGVTAMSVQVRCWVLRHRAAYIAWVHPCSDGSCQSFDAQTQQMPQKLCCFNVNMFELWSIESRSPLPACAAIVQAQGCRHAASVALLDLQLQQRA